MQLAEVHELVEAVGGLDPACRDHGVLAEVVAASARLRGWLDGRDTVLAAQVERVVSFPEKVLADASRTSLRDAERTVERVRTTSVLPQLGQALQDGVVSGAHVDVAGRALRQLEPRQRDGLVDRAGWLVDVAQRSTPEEFRAALACEVRRIQADDGVGRLERQRRATTLRTWVDHRDGMWCLAGRFDPATGVWLHGRLERVVAELFADRVPDTCPSDPSDKQDHLRAQALVALVDGRVRGGGRPEVTVVVDVTSPAGPVIDWGLPVELPGRVLHELFAVTDPTVVVVRNGVVLHAPGQLDLGRSTRLASRAQRRALRAMYSTCAVPGCAVRFPFTQPHHIVWWERGGMTDLANLVPLCSKHHHCVHDNGWTLTLGSNRDLTIRTPDGQVMTTGPPG
jgi:hypothetical protein